MSLRIWHQSFTVLSDLGAYDEALRKHFKRVSRPDTEIVLHGMRPGTYPSNYPGTDMDLAGCVNDANDWAAELTSRGFSVRKLLDAQATKAGMVDAFQQIVGKEADVGAKSFGMNRGHRLVGGVARSQGWRRGRQHCRCGQSDF